MKQAIIDAVQAFYLADPQPTSSCAKQWAEESLQRTAGIPQEGRKYNLLFLALT